LPEGVTLKSNRLIENTREFHTIQHMGLPSAPHDRLNSRFRAIQVRPKDLGVTVRDATIPQVANTVHAALRAANIPIRDGALGDIKMAPHPTTLTGLQNPRGPVTGDARENRAPGGFCLRERGAPQYIPLSKWRRTRVGTVRLSRSTEILW
jgi:hypothetical protein